MKNVLREQKMEKWNEHRFVENKTDNKQHVLKMQ